MTRTVTVRILSEDRQGQVRGRVYLELRGKTWKVADAEFPGGGFETIQRKATLLHLVENGREERICHMAPVKSKDMLTFIDNVETQIAECLPGLVA